MYGERDDPATVLSRLGKRLEKTAVPGDTLPTLVEDNVIAAAGAASAPPVHRYPLVYQSQAIGHLLVVGRAEGEEFTASEE